jgi:competence protein ComEA
MGVRWGRGVTTIVVVVVAVALGIGLGLLRRPSLEFVDSAEPTSSQPGQHDPAEVHVGGWVLSPGVVSVGEGSIVADAIAAAGGFKPGAVTDAINLAAPVASGDQVIVPGPGDVPNVGSPETARAGPLSINTASVEQLQELPGVGPVLAERIVEHRESNGRFDTVEDLLDVPGIGEAKLAALSDLVRP